MPEAPTLGEIVAHRYDLAASCDLCRILVPLDAEALLRGRPFSVRVDTLRLRCRRCGALGSPWVTGQGNLTVGRPHIWPPEPALSRA
jgi:hypothetical protein